MPEIVTARLKIRPMIMRDADHFDLVLGDEEVMEFSDAGPLDRHQIRQWISQQIEGNAGDEKYGRWAIVLPDENLVVGYIGLTQDPERTRPGTAELGFRLARGYWGRGYASEAAQAVVRYAFERTETRRVIAIVDPHNLPSVRVLEKLGMRCIDQVMFEGYDHPDRVYAIDRPGRPDLS